MKNNNSLDLDNYMKQMKLSPASSRPWMMRKESEQSSFSKPKSTSRKGEPSPFKSLHKKFE